MTTSLTKRSIRPRTRRFWRSQATPLGGPRVAETGDHLAGDLEPLDLVEPDGPGAQPVLEIVGLLRDLVGDRDRLTLEVAGAIEPEPVGIGEREREPGAPRGVLEDALADLVGEVETGAGVAPLEQVDHPHRLVVVLEGADLGDHRGRQPDLRDLAAQDLVESPLSGVAEGGVAEVVTEGDGLRRDPR